MTQSQRDQLYIATALAHGAPLLGLAGGPAMADFFGQVQARALTIAHTVGAGTAVPVQLGSGGHGNIWQVIAGALAGLHVPYHSSAWSVNPAPGAPGYIGIPVGPPGVQNYAGAGPGATGGVPPTFGGQAHPVTAWTTPTGLTYQQSVGQLQGAGLPIDLPSALSLADPRNPAQVAAIANSYYAGDYQAAMRAINNTSIGDRAANVLTRNPNGSVGIGAVTDKLGTTYAPAVYTPPAGVANPYITTGVLQGAVTGTPVGDPNAAIAAAVAANAAMYGDPSSPGFTGRPLK